MEQSPTPAPGPIDRSVQITSLHGEREQVSKGGEQASCEFQTSKNFGESG